MSFSIVHSAVNTLADQISEAAPRRTQPWKAFWPLNQKMYTTEQQAKMPWLTWKPDPAKPDDKPWRHWRVHNQCNVARRGANY